MNTKSTALVQTFKKGYSKFEQIIRKFVYSDFYLLLVSLILFLGWVTECAPFGISAMVVVTSIVLLGSDDILPLTVNIFGAALVIYTSEIDKIIFMWPMFLLLIPCLIIFIVKNCRHKFRLGKMFYPQLAVSLALLLGGAGAISAADYARALPTALILGFGVLAIYLLYNHFLKRDSGVDIPKYFSKTMMYIGIVISLELIVVIIRANLPFSEWHTEYWDVGWGNRNNISTYLILTAGLTMYLSTKERFGWIYFALSLFQYFCIIMSFSRGGIIFGAVSGAIAFVLTLVKSGNKKRALISTGIILAIALILYLIFMDKINAMIVSLMERGMGTSGRTDLYQEAWDCFKAFPFFGAGLGYSGPNFEINVMSTYWFHSTFFQVIGCMGIVGFAAYVYYYVIRAKLLFKDIKNTFNLFIMAIWIGFEGYSMIDTGTFVPYPNMMFIIISTLLLELNIPCNKQDYYNLPYAAERK